MRVESERIFFHEITILSSRAGRCDFFFALHYACFSLKAFLTNFSHYIGCLIEPIVSQTKRTFYAKRIQGICH